VHSTPISFRGAGGVTIAGDALGPVDGLPVVFLHGGGQTRHAWGAAARAVARTLPGSYVVSLDHRGHGDSGWPEDEDYLLTTFAEDVRQVAAQLGRAPAVIGASLGGLAALMAEGERPADGEHVLRALILVDVAPRMEQDGVRRIIAFMETGLDGFESLEHAGDAIAAYLPHRRRPRDLAGLAKNLRQSPDGRWRWHWDPRFVRRSSGDPSFALERLEAAARRIDVPTLVVRGRMSDVLSEEGVREVRALIPHAAYVDVAGASHMVAGDDNDAFTSAVIEFLAGAAAAADAQIARSRPAQ
jgi:pimeloyl-ACP methyl ester carboxylesterase